MGGEAATSPTVNVDGHAVRDRTTKAVRRITALGSGGGSNRPSHVALTLPLGGTGSCVRSVRSLVVSGSARRGGRAGWPLTERTVWVVIITYTGSDYFNTPIIAHYYWKCHYARDWIGFPFWKEKCEAHHRARRRTEWSPPRRTGGPHPSRGASWIPIAPDPSVRWVLSGRVTKTDRTIQRGRSGRSAADRTRRQRHWSTAPSQ